MNKEKSESFSRTLKIIIITVIITAVISSYATIQYVISEAGISKFLTIKAQEPSESSRANINKISSNLGVLRTIIDSTFIGEKDEKKLMDGALKGYVSGLGDIYTEYMTEEEWNEFEASALGDFVGIGIYIGEDKDGNAVILSPIKGSPAEEVGLQKGDVIYKVDDEEVAGKDPDLVSSKIKGEEGTEVKVTVYRDGELLDFNLTREKIQVYHVESEVLDNGIGYVEILSFDENCDEELHEKIEEFRKKNIHKIIIDLRFNGGGLVDSALGMLDELTPKGAIQMYTMDSNGKEEVFRSNGRNYQGDLELVVLVNEYSASASEILTAALKENQKAKVVGINTFGKGVIQTVYPLSNGARLKITSEEYYTPDHNKLNHVGVKPDIEVEYEDPGENPKKVGDIIIDNQIQAAIDALK